MSRIYFNLDLTLTEMDRSFDECLGETLKELGVPEKRIEPERYSEIFFELFEDMKPEPRRKAFRKYFKENEIDESPDKASRIYREKELDAVTPVDGLSDVLEQLSNSIELGVVTAGTAELQRKKLEKLGLEELLDNVMITYEEGSSKKEILEELDEEDVYISTSESDIEKAREADVKSVKLDRSKPEKLLHKIEEIA
ncbi:MAG: HAD family hydrolase [Candidatus Nanosalina sp.]